MVKVEAVNKDTEVELHFETRNTTEEGLIELDDVYSALMGSGEKTGGYSGTNRFTIVVKK